ncbi:hypothetical protein ARMGADRAFT_1027067 [Armillaria gallica]|uniref:Uncharacterized protein n=1 Tax=Armillaria gallica TaxID=47427 RepID=A0A2H3DU36_ARMGA|nr:hypothetical protein ARMGADRAFT_1027067 [Armillaria gallica]
MKENNDNNQASSAWPAFVNDCHLHQLECHSRDAPGLHIFHNVTARIPVYIPVISQHVHVKALNVVAHHAMMQREFGSLASHIKAIMQCKIRWNIHLSCHEESLREPGQLRSGKDLCRSTNFCNSDRDENLQQGHTRWEKVILKMRHLSEKQGKRIQHVHYNKLDEAGSLPSSILGISPKDQCHISDDPVDGNQFKQDPQKEQLSPSKRSYKIATEGRYLFNKQRRGQGFIDSIPLLISTTINEKSRRQSQSHPRAEFVGFVARVGEGPLPMIVLLDQFSTDDHSELQMKAISIRM